MVGASGTGEPGVNELLGVSQKCMDKVAKGWSRQNCRLWASENCLIACHMVTSISLVKTRMMGAISFALYVGEP